MYGLLLGQCWVLAGRLVLFPDTSREYCPSSPPPDLTARHKTSLLDNLWCISSFWPGCWTTLSPATSFLDRRPIRSLDCCTPSQILDMAHESKVKLPYFWGRDKRHSDANWLYSVLEYSDIRPNTKYLLLETLTTQHGQNAEIWEMQIYDLLRVERHIRTIQFCSIEDNKHGLACWSLYKYLLLMRPVPPGPVPQSIVVT